MDKYYIFRNSRVFEKIFSQLAEISEPVRRGSSVGNIDADLSIEEFDKYSDEILFKKVCRENFGMLIRYPETQIQIKYLDQYWSNVGGSEINNEIGYILEYE